MNDKIKQDFERFREILRGQVRDNLQEHIIRGAIKGMQGKKTISIPLPRIDLPHFRYRDGQGGVGQGEGEEGDILGRDGKGKPERAGDQPGEHEIELDITLDELLDSLVENLELPYIEPKGKKNIIREINRYTGISRSGPESLRHNKRTYKEALKRSIASGNYNPDKPIIIPVREDKRYRSKKTYIQPLANAAIIYMMDVSGSMGEKQKELVRVESFWIDAWLRKNYNGLESRYIIHDAKAQEVDRQTFFTTKESGGTAISSAYKLCQKIMESDYPASDWNIYAFQFTDGDNLSEDDSKLCAEILKENLLPNMNMFGYTQVKSEYGSGEFIEVMGSIEDEKLILTAIDDEEDIIESIKDLFTPGK